MTKYGFQSLIARNLDPLLSDGNTDELDVLRDR